MTTSLRLIAAFAMVAAIAACDRDDGTINGMRTGGGSAGTTPQPAGLGRNAAPGTPGSPASEPNSTTDRGVGPGGQPAQSGR